MGVLGKMVTGNIKRLFCRGILLCFILTLGIFSPVYAKESTDKAMSGVDMGRAVVLYAEPESYEVQKGDCLWEIADSFFGDGARYRELLTQNEDVLDDPDLIYPGMILRVAKEVYVPAAGAYASEASMGAYRFGMPIGWTVGVLGDNDIGANFVYFGDGMESILCLIRDKEASAERTVGDWEYVQEYISAYTESEYADNVSELSFEKYYSADGDEVCFYTYTYTLDFADYGLEDSGTIDFRVCAGIRLTDRISAQFIGYTIYDNIEDAVRYAAASFEETAAPGEKLHVNDSNMSIWPDSTWDLEGMYDPFPWVAEYMGDMAQSVTDRILETEDEEQSETEGGKNYKDPVTLNRALRQKEELKENAGSDTP